MRRRGRAQHNLQNVYGCGGGRRSCGEEAGWGERGEDWDEVGVGSGAGKRQQQQQQENQKSCVSFKRHFNHDVQSLASSSKFKRRDGNFIVACASKSVRDVVPVR